MHDITETIQNPAKLCRYAVYVRVSTGKQTVENQRLLLIEYCKARGLEFDIYEEVESSRKTRPVKQEIMNMLRNGRYKGIVIYRLDRFARSFEELILSVSEIVSKLNLEFISVSDNLDFSSASGRLLFHVLSAFACFEKSLIAERTREGLARARIQGRILGRPPGRKDSKPRRRSGYILRQALKKQEQDQKNGSYEPIQNYIDS
jgi:DNA invertase Pin-like site-specific DNA recombinase